jgi:hypothetical protein
MVSNRCRSRQQSRRQIKRLVLILCEGEKTEVHYFRSLSRYGPVVDRYTVRVKHHPNAIEKAVYTSRRGLDGVRYDCICAVVDAEGRDRQEKIRALMPRAADSGVVACISNPCFEVWPLLHLENTSQMFEDAAKVIARLSPIWHDRFGCDYDKTDPRIFERLADHTETAISRSLALWNGSAFSSLPRCPLSRNPSTQVHEIVSGLMGLSELPNPVPIQKIRSRNGDTTRQRSPPVCT